MNSRVLWETWQRILRSDPLRVALMDPNDEEGKRAVAALDPEQKEVFDGYANAAASDMYVGVYRKFLFDTMNSAIRLTPMSARIFDESPIAHRDILGAFAKHTHYRDDGPNFWRAAGDLLSFLQNHAPFSSGPANDIAKIEGETTVLARQLCGKDVWRPAVAIDLENISPTQAFRQRGNAVIVSSEHDLTSWIENPREFDPNEALPNEHCFWAAYFENDESAPSYVELSERGAELYRRLATPQTCRELSKAMQDYELDEEDALAIVASLVELDIVVPA